MKITFDPAKRDRTLADRGLDFAEAADVFEGTCLEQVDDRFDYRKTRIVTIGFLRNRMVVVVWTPTDDEGRRIISMRKANEREQARFGQRFGKG